MSGSSEDEKAGERGEDREGATAPKDEAGEGAESASKDAEREGDGAGEGDGSGGEEREGEASSSSDEGKALKSAEADGDDVAEVASPPKPEVIDRPSYVFLAVVTAVTLAADLGSKAWALHRFEGQRETLERHVDVWKGVLGFRLAKNPGGAWGLLGGEAPAVRITFFVIISLVAVAFILSLYRKTSREQKALMWGLPLVLGGALGNLVDRIRYGKVIDFIDVQLFQYPTFNVADIAIVAGVGLMAIDMFTPRRRRGSQAKTESVNAAT